MVNIHKADDSTLNKKCDCTAKVASYHNFVKAMNYIIVKDNLVNKMFLDGNTEGFEAYSADLLKNDLASLCEKAGVTEEKVRKVVKHYNEEPNAIIIFNEKNISSPGIKEIFSLALLTGKLGKTASGVIALKEKNNAQGLFDMGIYCGCEDCSCDHSKIKNIFIFGEDPVGCSADKKTAQMLDGAEFKVVSDYFMTETAKMADVILPASFPVETGGSFSNTQKRLVTFEAVAEPKAVLFKDQLISLMEKLGVKAEYASNEDILKEAVSKNQDGLKDKDDAKFIFETTEDKCDRTGFGHGCDIIVKMADDEFAEKLKK